MKKLLFVSAAAFASMAMAANHKPLVMTRQMAEGGINVPNVKIADANQYVNGPKHAKASDEFGYDDYSALVADTATFYYYGDLFNEGTALYYLTLSSAPLNEERIPAGEGKFLRVMLVAEATDERTPHLVPGTYTMDTDMHAIGTNYDYYDDMYDVFYYNDMLVGYYWQNPTSCTVVVEENDGVYNITVDMHAFNKDSETGEVYAEEDIHMTYTGGMTFTLDKDPDAEIGYPDIDSDYDVEILGVSGRYDEFMYDGVTAYLNLAMYNLPLDEEGFIIGAGDLLSIEIIAPHMDVLDLDALCGTYTYLDMMTATSYDPWTFMGGYFYDMYGFVIAAGTSLSVYDEAGNVTNAALTQDGTITISKADGPNYTVALDSHTQTGKHLTASWTGPLAGYIWDYISGNEPVAIENVALQPKQSSKAMENNTLVIRSNGRQYNGFGQMIKGL